MDNFVASSNKLVENIPEIINKYNLICQKLLQQDNSNSIFDPFNLQPALVEFTNQIFANPEYLIKKQQEYFTAQIEIIDDILKQKNNDVICSKYNNAANDRRFSDQTWDTSPIFNYFKQSYFMTSNWLSNMGKELDFSDQKLSQKVSFCLEQIINALSPTNYPITNPEVIRQTINSNGENLLKGLDNFLGDIQDHEGPFIVKNANNDAFEVGKNLAFTEGNVIFENEIFQLIRYNNKQANPHSLPLLIIPPCINKFYIFDLQEKNSFVKWLLSQGHNLYIISWANPTKEQNFTYEDYIIKGINTAIDKVRYDSDVSKINTMGYCIGGTMLMTSLAYLQTSNKQYINSATFLTTLIDFSDAGQLSLFIDSEASEKIKKYIDEKGCLSGKEMSLMFNLLKSNDLIWPYYVNNYLLGKEPFPFDILYWNSDSTRLAGAMHSYYLENMYVKNMLVKNGGISIGGQKINISDVKVPCYFLSTIDDHIAPWKSTFKICDKLDTQYMNFVLAGSGHVGGVINHPDNNRYFYHKNNIENSKTSEEWFNSSIKHDGSWWGDWQTWVSTNSQKLFTNKVKVKSKLKSLENAPGRYVMEK